ncbi:hypothetical protein LSCM1_07377 [Leishmania martiniquensis]|uniref:C2H2-type domain-containing protein n=1 Tax=Leishmania martiniquensis TaxID=1580590 RepID=A0A836H5I5_9TRYP|nr:hypothetical protein LSCM1_07377 [Leishmania martiniquensis]
MRRIAVAACQRRWLALVPLPRVGKCVTPWSGRSSLIDTAAPITTSLREVSTTAARNAPKDAPYQCGECGKAFRLLNALTHHIMTRHGNCAKALIKKDGRLVPLEPDQLKGTAHGGSPASTAPAAGAVAAASFSPLPSSAASPYTAPFATPLDHVAASIGGTAAPSAPPGPVSGVQAAAAPATAGSGEGGNGGDRAAADTEKRMFVCTVCQKTFRLEAALQHHYLAKHNMEMPTSSLSSALLGGASTAAATIDASGPSPGAPGSTTGGGSTTGSGVSGTAADNAAVPGGASSFSAAQYVRQQEGALPDAPQYQLDVAPNAPEEGDIAAHWRCVNICVLMGEVQEVEEGYIFQDHVLQFTVATEFASPAPGDPDMDFHTVRVYGHDFWAPLKEDIQTGGRFLVTGRLCMVPQFDMQLRKYYHYPVIQVFAGSGNVVRV